LITCFDLQQLCSDKNIKITAHSVNRFRERGIKYKEVFCVIKNDEIIEQYPNDFPYPSCLLLGYPAENTPLHVVVGTNGEELYVITAYYPNSEKWEDDYKTRRGQE
jgi:hypothetical protein